MPILPASLPIWAYLAAGGVAFVAGRAATAGAGSADDQAAAAAGDDTTPTAGNDPYASDGALWDAYAGGGDANGAGALGGQFGYGAGVGPTGDYSGLGDYLDSYFGVGPDPIDPGSSPTPLPTPAPAAAKTPYLWGTWKAGTYPTYSRSKLKNGAACSKRIGDFKTGGFSNEVRSLGTLPQCDGSGSRATYLIVGGVHAGVITTKPPTLVTKYR